MANAAAASGMKQKPSRRKLPARRLFTVDDYYRMYEAGVFAPDERIELIEGEIIEMAPIGDRHGGCVIGLTDLFAGSTHGRALLGVQTALRLTERLEPAPDVVLLHPRDDRYRRGHPTAKDVFFLVEVSDTTLPYDRGTKLPLYAREAIAEVWIVDLVHERVEVYRRPENGRYQDARTFTRGTTFTPLAFPDLRITVDEILG